MLNFGLNKRQKIILTAASLSLMLLGMGFVPILFYLSYKFYFIFVIGLVAYFLSLWSLWEGIDRLKAFTLMILPTMFTLSVANYNFLLTSKFLTVIVAFIYGIIFYTLLLSENIFNVASIRTIPLYRVASFTVFILTAITSFVLFNVIFTLNLFYLWNGVAVFLLSYPLVLHVLWSVEMEELSQLIIFYALGISLIVGETALALSFWPLFKPDASLIPLAALFLAILLSVFIGITTQSFKGRLNKGVVWEHLIWGILSFLTLYLFTSWSG